MYATRAARFGSGCSVAFLDPGKAFALCSKARVRTGSSIQLPRAQLQLFQGMGFFDIKILLCFLVLLFLMTLWKLRLSLY